jgi:hypothetical protein
MIMGREQLVMREQAGGEQIAAHRRLAAAHGPGTHRQPRQPAPDRSILPEPNGVHHRPPRRHARRRTIARVSARRAKQQCEPEKNFSHFVNFYKITIDTIEFLCYNSCWRAGQRRGPFSLNHTNRGGRQSEPARRKWRLYARLTTKVPEPGRKRPFRRRWRAQTQTQTDDPGRRHRHQTDSFDSRHSWFPNHNHEWRE